MSDYANNKTRAREIASKYGSYKSGFMFYLKAKWKGDPIDLVDDITSALELKSDEIFRLKHQVAHLQSELSREKEKSSKFTKRPKPYEIISR